VRVLKAMRQTRDMLRYYVTFEAKNGVGETKIYQTLARWRRFPLVEDKFSLLIVREYKKDKGEAINYIKKRLI
jgi:hypothetical protein